jgi:hypothetical protein
MMARAPFSPEFPFVVFGTAVQVTDIPHFEATKQDAAARAEALVENFGGEAHIFAADSSYTERRSVVLGWEAAR